MPNLTISFKNDELERIDWYMKQYHMKRHEVVKLAVRAFLFPREEDHPVNGKLATEITSFHMGFDKEAKKSQEEYHNLYGGLTNPKEQRMIKIIPDKEKRFEVVSDEEAEKRRKKSNEGLFE